MQRKTIIWPWTYWNYIFNQLQLCMCASMAYTWTGHITCVRSMCTWLIVIILSAVFVFMFVLSCYIVFGGPASNHLSADANAYWISYWCVYNIRELAGLLYVQVFNSRHTCRWNRGHGPESCLWHIRCRGCGMCKPRLIFGHKLYAFISNRTIGGT